MRGVEISSPNLTLRLRHTSFNDVFDGLLYGFAIVLISKPWKWATDRRQPWAPENILRKLVVFLDASMDTQPQTTKHDADQAPGACATYVIEIVTWQITMPIFVICVEYVLNFGLFRLMANTRAVLLRVETGMPTKSWTFCIMQGVHLQLCDLFH
jgi:hypothetical protein